MTPLNKDMKKYNKLAKQYIKEFDPANAVMDTWRHGIEDFAYYLDSLEQLEDRACKQLDDLYWTCGHCFASHIGNVHKCEPQKTPESEERYGCEKHLVKMAMCRDCNKDELAQQSKKCQLMHTELMDRLAHCSPTQSNEREYCTIDLKTNEVWHKPDCSMGKNDKPSERKCDCDCCTNGCSLSETQPNL